jgi:hypothetical protein
MNPFAVALAMPAAEWLIFLLTSALFVFGMWLLVGEVRNWLDRRTELYGNPPSAIRLLSWIYRHHSERRPSIQAMPPEQGITVVPDANIMPSEQANTVDADVTAKKIA